MFKEGDIVFLDAVKLKSDNISIEFTGYAEIIRIEDDFATVRTLVPVLMRNCHVETVFLMKTSVLKLYE